MFATRLAMVVVALTLTFGAPAHGVPLFIGAAKCQQQIGKQGQRFKRASLKAWQRCFDGQLAGGTCDAAGRDAAIASAQTLFVDIIARKCPSPTLFGAQTNGVGFAQSCDLDPSATGSAASACRTLPVTDAASLAACVACWNTAEVNGVVRALYPCLGGSVGTGIPLACGVPPASCPTGDADVACLRAIASAGIEYLMAREQAVEKCLDGVRLGRTAGPCPDLRTLARIAAADQRRLTRLATCRFLPSWWDVCPADSNGTCSDDIGSLVDLSACVQRIPASAADRLVCQQYPLASADGLTCASGAPTEFCDNGFDDDGDGFVDCDDSDCAADALCGGGTETVCNDGIDDDGDTFVDCNDSDCAPDPVCAPVGCSVPSDCPGSDNDCSQRACNSGVCGTTFTSNGTPLMFQIAGDCQTLTCDGMGGATSSTNDADLPNDGNQCTDDVCAGGMPSHPPTLPGTACAQNGGVECDGMGSCVVP